MNNPGRFNVQMPEPFTSPQFQKHQGKWYLGLVDIVIPAVTSLTKKWDVLHVSCLQAEGAVMGDSYCNVLRSIPLGEIKRKSYAYFNPVLHIPLRVTDVRELTIELRDSRGQLLPEFTKSTSSDTTKCTLELLWKIDTNH